MMRAAAVRWGVVLLVLIGAAALGGSAGCDEQGGSGSGSGKKLIKPGAGTASAADDKSIGVARDDKGIEQARLKAQQTLDEFIGRVLAPKPGDERFSIQKKFQERGKVEYMWVREITYSAQTQVFIGKLGNSPGLITGVKEGDRIKVTAEQVGDWAYISNGKLVGGYTLRVLRSRMSAAEKAKFDRDVGARIED